MFAERFRAIGNSGNEISQENGIKRVEEKESVMGAYHHLEIATIPYEENIQEGKSIIKPKRRIEASHLENAVYLGGQCAIASMTQSGIDDTRVGIVRY